MNESTELRLADDEPPHHWITVLVDKLSQCYRKASDDFHLNGKTAISIEKFQASLITDMLPDDLIPLFVGTIDSLLGIGGGTNAWMISVARF